MTVYHQNAKNYTSKAMQHFASSAGIFVSIVGIWIKYLYKIYIFGLPEL